MTIAIAMPVPITIIAAVRVTVTITITMRITMTMTILAAVTVTITITGVSYCFPGSQGGPPGVPRVPWGLSSEGSESYVEYSECSSEYRFTIICFAILEGRNQRQQTDDVDGKARTVTR